MTEKYIPDNQRYSPEKVAYWFWSFKEKRSLWRYDNDLTIDRQRKAAQNYFEDEYQADKYGELTVAQRRRKKRVC